MMKSKKMISLLLVAIGTVGLLWNYQREAFTGSRTKTADTYLLDVEQWNGTDLHAMELQKDDVLKIRFRTEKGSLHMEIKAPDETSLYRGNGKEISEFTVTISESGLYTIMVSGRHAKGSIHIHQTGGRQ